MNWPPQSEKNHQKFHQLQTKKSQELA